MAHHEKSLVCVDHPLDHTDDGRAFLRTGDALNGKLLVGALLLVQHIGSEDGGQVKRRHLVSCDLNTQRYGRDTGLPEGRYSLCC